MDLVDARDVRAAAQALAGIAVRTPVVPFPDTGGLWLKLENEQPIGAFKVRGAYHAIARLPEPRRERGVITHSSGNHGQAVGYAARAFGVPAVVVMPEGSVPLKIDRIRDLGGEVVIVPAADRLTVAERIAAERGLAFIPPYDHRDVIAGQGTVGLEILDQLPEVEVVLAPVGGGGLISGIATAVKALRPDVSVIGVEPELAADAAESLRAGHLVPWSVEDRGRTVADGVRTDVGELTLAHILERVDDIVTVTEDDIRDTVVTLARTANITAEPSGALAAAAYLRGPEGLPAGRTVAVVSGGNIDPALRQELLNQ
ncbi:MAG: threonine ammonia-lyase [Stackebrandtia sp.]